MIEDEISLVCDSTFYWYILGFFHPTTFLSSFRVLENVRRRFSYVYFEEYKLMRTIDAMLDAREKEER